MIHSAFRARLARFAQRAMAALATVSFLAAPVAASASQASYGLFDHPKYASIVVDANTGEVLFALRADAQRVPASITKIMTLYLTFEALETGRVKLSDPITVSAHAASMGPSKTNLRPGERLTVDEAIRVVAILSANDIAVALGEHLGASEPHFAQLMTLRAQELGMRNTHFINASGLPGPGNNITTARDIAILSRAVMRDYPQFYNYFSQGTFDFRGRHLVNHNHLLLRMPGVDGLKTGFTNAAGYNLAASALRDGRRVITVVLGGSSTAARDENVEDLLSAGFNVLNARQHGQNISVASLLSAPLEAQGAVIRPSTDYGSGEQQGLQLAAADPLHLPGQISDAMMNPTPVGGPIRTGTHQECEQVRTTVMVRQRHHRHAVAKTVISTRCHQSSAANVAPMRVIARTVVQTAPNCSRLRGRARTRCHASERASEGVAVASATPQCDKIKGAKARASCRRIEGGATTQVASVGKTCTGKGRHRHCTTAGRSEEVTVASAKLRGCTGKAKHSKACRAAETAEASPVKKTRRAARAG